MFDSNKLINDVAAVFQTNIGNRITVELANGMIQSIAKLIPEIKIEEDKEQP